MTDVAGKRAPFEAAIETRLLYEKLLTVDVGATILYDDLCAEIKQDVQNEAYKFLSRARLWCEKRNRIVFECVVGIGLKRVTDAGTIGVMQNARTRVRGIARRALNKAACADYDKLDPTEKRAYNVERAQLGLARSLASDRTGKKLLVAAEQSETFTQADALQRLRASGMVK